MKRITSFITIFMVSGANWVDGRRFSESASSSEVAVWVMEVAK